MGAALKVEVLLVPSLAARTEWPRRLAASGRAVAGLYALRLRDLLAALAEPALLGRGVAAWDPGHDALLAARLLGGVHSLRLPTDAPLAPVAAALARTLAELRLAGVQPERVSDLGERAAATAEDRARLGAVAALYRAFHEAREDKVADPATLLRAARAQLPHAAAFAGAEFLIVDDLELAPLERDFLAALASRFRVRRLARPRPPSLQPGSFAAFAESASILAAPWSETILAPAAPGPPRGALARLQASLFEPPAGERLDDASVELLTAPGEAAEVRAIVRRLLGEARAGVPFEEMGVVLPRANDYAPLFTDLLSRLGIPHRLHPSLPLRYGRAARALLLLLRCRGLARAAVMEFLTFAPLRAEALLPDGELPRPARWDQVSRDARIVSGLERWRAGLAVYARGEREASAREPEARRERREERARDADTLLALVDTLAETLEELSGRASWPEWSRRLARALDRWIGPERDADAVRGVLADLAGLAALGGGAPWHEVESVLEARLEWERVPLEAVAGGAIHVGALDAMAGLTFRVVAIPGLVEGGYPGPARPDPFLLDPEREALAAAPQPDAGKGRQLALFHDGPRASSPLRTAQDRVLEARRDFQRAVAQASERLILSYPRADARSGRERMPSLFFVAAATTLAGAPVSFAQLARSLHEDPPVLAIEDALDASERDRARVQSGGRPAAEVLAGGSLFFKQSRLATDARWSHRLTAYDGLVMPLAVEVARKLDPVTGGPISASRLASFARCGFQYLLQHVLKLEAALEPEERRRLEPLERGNLFHEVAELYLRERREKHELPVADTKEARARLLEMADAALERFLEGSPPRFTLLWEREKARFRDTLARWLAREASLAGASRPAHFELGFGLPVPPGADEPHSAEPLTIELGDGRTLRVSGRIDRIDERDDGTLVLRDYKTGKAPWRETGGFFKGGRQLQIPFYILAAAKLIPDKPVAQAFLDYVDGGRQVSLDPASVKGDIFRNLLKGLVDAIASGTFVQEPSACEWCDFTAVCGPAPLIALRRAYKQSDPRVLRVLRLRDMG
jgi:ATP-dependent helicase/nuclease subunit B